METVFGCVVNAVVGAVSAVVAIEDILTIRCLILNSLLPGTPFSISSHLPEY